MRPNTPIEGIPKEPNTPDNPRVGNRLKQAGATAGINFTGLTDRAPNTVRAHSCLEFALESGGPTVQNHLMDILFRHYFTDGKFADDDNLRAACVEAGVDADNALRFADETGGGTVERALEHSRQGISGVPYFFVDRQPLFSGAQPPATFKGVLDKALGAKR